jgi:hypothetical protein
MITRNRTLMGVAALVVSAAALAGQAGSRNDGSRSIQVKDPAVFSGVTIRPGSYKLSWFRQHGSEDVDVTISSGRRVLASGKGRWIESVMPSPFEAVVYHAEGGFNELSEIRFEQSAEAIRIDGGSTRADSGEDKGPATN